MKEKSLIKSALRAESLLKTLANSNRLMILCHLIEQPMTVSELSQAIELSQSAVSQHLKRLRDEQVVSSRVEGKHAWYFIDSTEVSALMSVIHLIFCHENTQTK
ncbi:ArsR/SmtB family transcription factor [Glaciecola siphonariae]|uniref:ArsR/SmtB family transcription factor n=1 Tax=Glaciecola siphonariae TaxID=521012 RepID=A0ABV9LY13_9ALTE